MATWEDAQAVLRVGKRMHEESVKRYAPIPWKWPIAEAYARTILADPAHWRCFMAERAGECVGFFIAKVRTFGVFSDVLCGFEGTFYVAPEARGSSAFPRMLKAAEDWAREKGAVMMTVVFSAGITAGTGMERFGYALDGHVYRKDF